MRENEGGSAGVWSSLFIDLSSSYKRYSLGGNLLNCAFMNFSLLYINVLFNIFFSLKINDQQQKYSI